MILGPLPQEINKLPVALGLGLNIAKTNGDIWPRSRLRTRKLRRDSIRLGKRR